MPMVPVDSARRTRPSATRPDRAGSHGPRQIPTGTPKLCVAAATISIVRTAITCATATTTSGRTRRLTTPPMKSEVPQARLESSASRAVTTPRLRERAHPGGRSARRLPGQRNPTYAASVAARDPHSELPAGFAEAVASLQPVRLRAEIRLSEAPAPQRLAPFAVALTADVTARVATRKPPPAASSSCTIRPAKRPGRDRPGSSPTCAPNSSRRWPATRSLADVAWTWLTEGAGPAASRAGLPGARRHGHPRDVGLLRHDGRSAAGRARRVTGVVDAGHRRPRPHLEAWATSSRPPPGWLRCPRESPHCRAAAARPGQLAD